MFSKTITKSVLFSLLVAAKLYAVPFYCSDYDASFADKTHCESVCLSSCQELEHNSNTSMDCDTGNFTGFIYYKNKTYAISKNSGFWEDFKNLAIVSNEQVNLLLKSIIAYTGASSAWIGAFDPNKSTSFGQVVPSRFVWNDYTRVYYSVWSNGEPNNFVSDQDIGVVPINGEHWVKMNSDGTWSDEGYHKDYGGDYKPRMPALVEWNGALSCVSGLSPSGSPIDDVINKYCNGKSPCYVCTDGNEIFGCENSSDGYICPKNKVRCDSTYEEPSCPAGGSLDTSANMCRAEPNVTCPTGYTWNREIDRCVRDVECPDGGTFNPNTDRCEKLVQNECPSGYSYDAAQDKCWRTVDCSPGTFNATKDRCEMPPAWDCPDGYSYSAAAGKCEASPYCPSGTAYNTQRDRCEENINTCPTGYSYNTVLNKCVSAATCSDGGTLNAYTDKCEVQAAQTCPSGWTLNPSTNKCEKTPACASPGTFSTANDMCLADVSGTNCPTGYTYSASLGKCVDDPVCVGGAYNAGTDRCETPVTYTCPDTSYTYNAASGRCEKVPVCFQGTYSTTYDKCLLNFSKGCDTANGYTYNASRDRCEKAPPVCPSGTSYNPLTNRCEGGSACANGNYNPSTGMCNGTTTATYDKIRVWTGTIGDNYWSGWCSQYSSSANFYINDVNKIIDFKLKRAKFDDWIKITVNNHIIYVGPYGGDRLNVVGEDSFSLFGDPLVKYVQYTSSQYGRCELGTSWDQYPDIDAKPYLINGTNTVKIDVIVSGLGEGYAYFEGTVAQNNLNCTGGSCSIEKLGSQNITTTASYPTQCPSGLVNSNGICVANPTCPVSYGWSSFFDGTNDVCYTAYRIECPSGYSYDAASKKCVSNPICSNGLLDTVADKCYQNANSGCPSGYTRSGSVCYRTPTCDSPGTFQSSADKCVYDATFSCPSGYTYSATYGKCYKTPDCGSGSLNGSTDKCEISYALTCPSSYSLNGTVCQKSPVCSSPGSYNASIDYCDAGSDVCPAGMALDTSVDKCWKSSSCGSGGVLNVSSDKCEATATANCGTWTYDSANNLCYSNPVCQNGSYDAAANECKATIIRNCGTYSWDGSRMTCYSRIQCPNGGVTNIPPEYSPELNQCVGNPDHKCPSGYTYNSTKCEAVPICVEGVYNPDNDKCYLGDNTCPLGNYPCVTSSDGKKYCSPYSCEDASSATTNEDTQEGKNDKQNDGEIDDNGNCLGQIYIFNGNDRRCREAGLQTGGSDCCKKGSTWFGLGQCNEKEKTLSKLREFGELDGQCHYIGDYCSSKVLGVCIQKKKTYCCFSSPLGRIIQEGGRSQLGIAWGEPKSPNCRGFTPEEFQKIDFSKIDFSEWIKYDVIPNVQNSAVQNINNAVENMKNSMQ